MRHSAYWKHATYDVSLMHIRILPQAYYVSNVQIPPHNQDMEKPRGHPMHTTDGSRIQFYSVCGEHTMAAMARQAQIKQT